MCRLVKHVHPDLAVVDINLADGSGFDIFSCPELREGGQSPAVLFISMYIKPTYVVKALSLGGKGYVTKDSPSDIIYRAAEAVTDGHHFFDPLASDALVEWVRSIPDAGGLVQDDNYNRLTEREKEIFQLLSQGKSTSEIAATLFLSRKTVMNYRNTIFHTLGIESVFELRAYAEEMGLQ